MVDPDLGAEESLPWRVHGLGQERRQSVHPGGSAAVWQRDQEFDGR